MALHHLQSDTFSIFCIEAQLNLYCSADFPHWDVLVLSTAVSRHKIDRNVFNHTKNWLDPRAGCHWITIKSALPIKEQSRILINRLRHTTAETYLYVGQEADYESDSSSDDESIGMDYNALSSIIRDIKNTPIDTLPSARICEQMSNIKRRAQVRHNGLDSDSPVSDDMDLMRRAFGLDDPVDANEPRPQSQPPLPSGQQ